MNAEHHVHIQPNGFDVVVQFKTAGCCFVGGWPLCLFIPLKPAPHSGPGDYSPIKFRKKNCFH